MKNMHWYDHLNINIFWLGLNIRNNAMGTYFMPYLVDMFVRPEIKNTALSEMRWAGLVIAMLVQPAMGLLSDRSTSRFGRRRPFIVVGVILDLIFLAFVALSWDYWSLLVAVLLQQFSANISHGALQGLIPDLVPENQRGVASGVKAIMELIPLILLAFSIARLMGAGQLGWAVFVTGAALLLTMLLTLFLVKEEPLHEKPAIPLGPPMKRVVLILVGFIIGSGIGLLCGAVIGAVAGLIAWPFLGFKPALGITVGLGGIVAMAASVLAGVRQGVNRTLGAEAASQGSFVGWVINRLMFLAAVTSIQGFAPYFLMYAFNVTREESLSMTGNLMMVVGLFTLATALPSGWLSDRFGHRILVGISGIVAAAGTCLLLSTIWLPNLTMVYVAGIILGLGAGLFTTTNWALGAVLVPPAEAGRYLGISNLAGAGAGMIGAGIGGPMADYLNTITPGLGYFVVFAGYAVLFALSTVTLRLVHYQKPTPNQVLPSPLTMD